MYQPVCQMLKINFMQDEHGSSLPVGSENLLKCFERCGHFQIYILKEENDSHGVQDRK